MKRFLTMLLCVVLLISVVGCSQEGNEYEIDEERGEAIVDDAGVVSAPNNGNGRVYYQIFVGSFSDSNGDGIGDLRGIINRFDYLNDGDDNSGLSLGVEGIWLSPIFTSPSYHKYDVTDYYEIDPQFGTMEDLQELIELCHSRGVQIILDLVINHTSKKNQWYQDFVFAHQVDNPNHAYYDFYSWGESSISGATSAAISGSTHYYECNFSGDMPELNYDNEAVRQAMLDVAKYYLDMGIDGFRFDAAKYIYYGNEPKNAEFWIWYMNELRAIKPDIYTVAEVWDSDATTFPYFESTNCFNFTISQAMGLISTTAKGGDVGTLTTYVGEYLNQIKSRREDAMMCTFIANHDTDRAAGFVTVASGQAYVAANLSLLMPGSTFVYYGEEIGMKGSRGAASTDANRRLAMLWGDGDTISDPIGTTYNSEQINGTVADQLAVGTSLYNHYKKLITIRKANPEIVYGSYTQIVVPDSNAGGFLATYEGSTVAVLHNTTTEAVQIDLSQVTDVSLTIIAAYAGMGSATLDGTTLTIEAQTSVVLR